MRGVQADEPQAFEELYERYAGRALGLAIRMCANRAYAEEAVQDAFLGVWRARAQYAASRGAVRPWVFALVRNRCIDTHRRYGRGDRLRAPEARLRNVAASNSVENDAVQAAERATLRDSVDQLPGPQREAIMLAYYEGLTHAEIAQCLRLPLGTVKGRMRLGLTKIAAAIAAPSPPRAGTRDGPTREASRRPG